MEIEQRVIGGRRFLHWADGNGSRLLPAVLSVALAAVLSGAPPAAQAGLQGKRALSASDEPARAASHAGAGKIASRDTRAPGTGNARRAGARAPKPGPARARTTAKRLALAHEAVPTPELKGHRSAAAIATGSRGQPGIVTTARRPSPATLPGGRFDAERHPQPLGLHSSAALMLDAVTGRLLYQKNAHAVRPIASISKLMTAIVVLDAGQPLDEPLRISRADVDTLRHTGSRLAPGTVLTRGEMLHLALMSSENRAANALGRHYPGGMRAFVARMNARARELGMERTRFVEPTGLSSSNVSTAHDLARLVVAASAYPLIRAYSTHAGLTVETDPRPARFRNTNRLVRDPDWDIHVQKTGYISDAGNCLVMQASIEGRPTVLVLLDAEASLARFGDARRLREWVEARPPFGADAHVSIQSSRGS